ncbi:MAG: NAD(P)-dependent alcohol dehydrogenase [Magnetococcales bacterium]|nr:NAD(P)-dependent alcohol dehydrogenase [Magnetococcales bacterium]
MRVFEVNGAFGVENLKQVERQEPKPGPGQVVVRMGAASLNYRDLLMVQGHYNPRQPLPLIPLSDGAGEVVAVGAGVSRVAVGDRVMGLFVQKWLDGPFSAEGRASTLGGPLDGMLAEYQVLDAEGVVITPDHLSDAEAACLPCAALTAWNALFAQGRLQAGQSVLLQGTGGVSINALQLAKAAGARVIITSSSDEKLQRAKTLGADDTINYKEVPKWGKAVLELTDGLGVDHVVEVGGAETLAQSLTAVRFGGAVHAIGVLAGVMTKLPVTSILMKHVRVQGIFVGSRAMFEGMNRALTQHEIHPVVDKEIPFSEAPEAFTMLGKGGHFGKIVITF